MNAITVYPSTNSQMFALEEFLEKMKLRFSIKKAKKTDDTLYTKEAYFAMLDQRIKDIELGNSRLFEYTPELEQELFAEIL